jgi:BON domain-containing protein
MRALHDGRALDTAYSSLTRRHDMARLGTTIAVGGVGAALMYAFDPERGRARRARLRDKLVHAEHELAGEAHKGIHDLTNRSRGIAHDVAAVAMANKADDDVVRERVRARLGRSILHPRGIEVEVQRGIVKLKGPVLRNEVQSLVRACKRVRGVRHVGIELLDIRDEPGNIGALHGGRHLGRRTITPSTRIVLVSIGLLALVQALRRLL